MGRWDVGGAIPHRRAINKAAQALRNGFLVLYPTDTTYAVGCLISHRGGFDALCKLRGVRPDKSLFSVFLPELSAIGRYALGIDTPTYRLLKRLWPGPYTIILRAGAAIPRHLWHRKTVGFRVTAYPIIQSLLEEVQEPIVTASVPQDRLAAYASQVAEFLDAGEIPPQQTTVIDLSNGIEGLRILRVGIGPVDELIGFVSLSEGFQEA
ncbi:MAG: L-threonylcarbamoyladenylate synthase [Bacteroidia bacterium]|nr:L-threonylcarbamoyladenylate synthase [Bacteroidia bacterium]MCX7651287.1 L-threonylcarbamoyladenylate synthase [Bacteroidia bacterium]MDW8416235.1 L-threonylcarbamoyladenylate synthase [Bacteroidia bacterium]